MARQRRSSEEWQRFIAEFEAGSDTVKAFCRSRGISTSNFNKRRRDFAGRSAAAFVAARRVAPSASAVTVQIDDVVVRCDTQTSVTWVCDLVTALRR